MDIQPAISLIGASQGIFLSVLFFIRSKRHPSLFVLGLYILLFSCGLLEPLHHRESAGTGEKMLFSFIANANLLYGPLIYLFLRYLKQPFISNKTWIVHCLPFLIFFCGEILMILDVIHISENILQWLDLLLFELFVVQLVTYSIFCLLYFRKIRHQLLQTYSNLNISDINWLSSLLYIIATIYILSFLFTHLILLGLLNDKSVFVVIQLMIVLVTYAFGYRMYISPSFFDLKFREQVQSDKLPEQSKYQKSGLKADLANEHLQRLLSYMEEERPYKDAELTIFDLANRLQMTRNHLTEILNVYCGKNFYEFINMYRVEEAKRLLSDETKSHLNIAGIGSEAGFRSSTSFYTNFKKITGLTPSTWKVNNIS